MRPYYRDLLRADRRRVRIDWWLTLLGGLVSLASVGMAIYGSDNIEQSIAWAAIGFSALGLTADMNAHYEHSKVMLAETEARAMRPDPFLVRLAAHILNVSDEYVCKLVVSGELPLVDGVLKIQDVLTYKQKDDIERDAALTELTRLTEGYGGYGK